MATDKGEERLARTKQGIDQARQHFRSAENFARSKGDRQTVELAAGMIQLTDLVSYFIQEIEEEEDS